MTDTEPASEVDTENFEREDWLEPEYEHRVRIKFLERAEPLVGFVAHVAIEQTPERFEGVARDQVRFVDADSGLPIRAELVEISSEDGLLEAWIGLETWRSNTQRNVHVYFGADAPAAPLLNPWGAGFRHVWHCNNTQGGELPDVMGEAPMQPPAGQAGSAMPSPTGGVSDRGAEFDGFDDQLNASVSVPGNGTSSFAVLGWFRSAVAMAPGRTIVSRSAINTFNWSVDALPNGVFAGVQQPNGDDISMEGEFTAASDWHHFAFTGDADTYQLYVDGELIAAQGSAGPPPATASTMVLGASNGGSLAQLFLGALDEIQVLSGPPTDEWVHTAFDNFDDPSSVYQYTGVESQ